MQTLSNYLQKRWVYHALIWLFIISPFVIIELINRVNPLEMLVSFSPVILTIYAHFYIKERFFQKKQYYIYALALVIISLLGGLLSTAIFQEFEKILSLKYLLYLLGEVLALLLIVLIAGGLQYIKRGLVNSYKLKEQLQELKVQNTESELQNLKAQINPHFLFNNLNNIYATVELDAEKGAEMIIELSEVMRYHLQSSKKSEITLTEEIQLVKSYIELEKLRLNKNCDLQIHLPEDNNNILLAPLVLLPYIENAFKHGTHPTQKCFVHLKLEVDERDLFFEIKNSIISHKKVVKTHIGLENTRKRLELIYPEKHKLDIEKSEREHCVRLKIRI